MRGVLVGVALVVGLGLSGCGGGTAYKAGTEIDAPAPTVTVTAEPSPSTEPAADAVSLPYHSSVVDYARAAGFPELPYEVSGTVGTLCDDMEGRRLDSEWTAQYRDGFVHSSTGALWNEKQAGHLFDVLVAGCVEEGFTTLWAPPPVRSHDDVVAYLNEHGIPGTNNDEFNASITESCVAIDGTKPGAPPMRENRAAWLESEETDAFVDTLFEGCYETGHSTRWAPPPPKTSFGTGTWLVGVDIASGTYRGGGTDCYWERLSGTSGDFDDIITNYIGDGPTVVTISSSDVAFQSNRCGTWTKIG